MAATIATGYQTIYHRDRRLRLLISFSMTNHNQFGEFGVGAGTMKHMRRIFIATLFVGLWLPYTGTLAETNSASLLGPSSSGQSAGGSSGDANVLQPANNAPIQPTGNENAQAPTTSSAALQAPASQDDVLKVLAGETENTPQETSETINYGLWLGFSATFALMALGAYLFVSNRRERREQRAHDSLATPEAD